MKEPGPQENDLQELVVNIVKQRGMSVTQAAHHAGLPHGMIQRWHDGRNLLTVARFFEFIEGMGYEIKVKRGG